MISLITSGLKAQSNLKPKIQSFELVLGIGKVGTIENDTYVYSLNNSPTYETEYIGSKVHIIMQSVPVIIMQSVPPIIIESVPL